MNETRAFIEMIQQYDRGLRALAYRLLRDRAAMDDVMQEAYLKAFRGYLAFRGEAQSSTWLYRIVYNACLDRLRSRRRTREVSLEALLEVLPGEGAEDAAGSGIGSHGWAGATAAGDPAEAVALKGDLAAVLALLPLEQRAAVLLVDGAGFSYDEAAEVLGAPSGTIASRLNHARSALRKTLAEGRDDGTF